MKASYNQEFSLKHTEWFSSFVENVSALYLILSFMLIIVVYIWYISSNTS